MAAIGRDPNAGLSPSPNGGDNAYAAMLARAEALIPKLSARASRTEELRRLPPETESELHESGLFRMLQPRRV
ncbi:MAG: acyl-CoA dehydrogenase, partial [Bradyrhizobium sp.]|nr:acyl-CoA dehydrogenase [Bradyrhizobium sp.]